MTLSLASVARPPIVSLGPDAQARWRQWIDAAPGDMHVAGAGKSVSERNILAARLDRAVAEAGREVLLIAEGTTCFAAAWWARLSPRSYVERIAGALLIDPRDEDAAPRHFASPRIRLPFPSLLIADEPGAAERIAAWSGEWGSRQVATRGNVDEARRWQRTRRLVTRFTAAIVEADMLRADKLRGAR